MKAVIILGERAISNDDGSVSIWRGGIHEIKLPAEAPLKTRLAVVVIFEAAPDDAGLHKFEVSFMSQYGEVLSARISEGFTVEGQGRIYNYAIEIDLEFPGPGGFTAILKADKGIEEKWEFEVKT